MSTRHRFPRRLRGTMANALAVGLLLLPQAAVAAVSCTFRSAVGANFGAYDVFAQLANDNGVGRLSIRCQGGRGPPIHVSLSTGQSANYASRVMRRGGNALNYNLYTSAARSVVWGDGTGSSSSVAAAVNSTTTLNIFGRIPAGQDARVGVYSDTIVTTVDF